MNIFRKLFGFYLGSSLHVALAVTSLAAITVFEFGYVPEPTVLLVIFFGTITGYNFVKYAGISNLHHLEITPHINLIRAFSILCLAALIYFGRLLPLNVIFMASGFGGLTLLYALPLYKGKNLRSIPGVKIFIIGLVWMGMTVLVPLEYHNLRFGPKVLYQCLEMFLFVIALTLPFEIRDLKYDAPQLSTIPQKIGIKNTKWLGTGLLIIAGMVSAVQNYVNEVHLYVSLGIFFITLIFLWGSKEQQGKYYASFWVEGLPVLWLILALSL